MKMDKHRYLLLFVLLALLTSCRQSVNSERAATSEYYPTSKPLTRWWWFATEIRKPDIRHQLDWAKAKNFGGVEIAWVYPLYRYQSMYARLYDRHYPKDTTAQKWLSSEWTEAISFTKSYADSIGLTCDFTFGSAWPVAADNIRAEYGTQIYGDTSFRQLLTFAWSWPDTFLVINHLDSLAFQQFANPISAALAPVLQGNKSALFTDSWEIKLNGTNKIWTRGFEDSFEKKFDYDILPYMEQGLDSFPDVRYDYMLLLDAYVTSGFYEPYVRRCREQGAWSRVQCLASPTDVMNTYALVDIPESEAMLNNPNFSRIVASSACLSAKKMVSSESFTCMYGFPGTYLRQEQTADLKLVADALFAQGVNFHVYHGMPYNPVGSDSIDFFATSYFGPGGSLEPDLSDFNSYIERVSGILQKGRTYSDVAVYIPYEDGVMKGAYPPERQRVWVWGEYEMRYIYPPEETLEYHPLWINRQFLQEAQLVNGRLIIGDASFSSLYVDVDYIDIRALERILDFATQGFPVCLKKNPSQPGKNKSPQYLNMLEALSLLKNVSDDFSKVIDHKPFISGDDLPSYWCRVDDNGDYYVFLAQPKAKNLEYPLSLGQSHMDQSITRKLVFNIQGKEIVSDVEFKPYQSLVLKISDGKNIEMVDIAYTPPTPIVKPAEKQRTYF